MGQELNALAWLKVPVKLMMNAVMRNAIIYPVLNVTLKIRHIRQKPLGD